MPRLRTAAVRALGASLLLAASLAAHAQQLHRCVDERGRTFYTEHPTAKCRPVAGTQLSRPAPPPAAAAKAPAKGAKGKKPPPKKAVLTAEERARHASRCKSLREQLAYLNSPRGSKVPSHTERVGQVEGALRACP